MLFTTVSVLCALGIVALSSSNGENKECSHVNESKKDLGDRDYVRENLRSNHFDNWECDDIAKRIRNDAWFRNTVERSLDNGKSFEASVYQALEEHGNN